MDGELHDLNAILSLLINDIISNDYYLPVYIPAQNHTQNVLQNSLYERNPIRHVITDEVKNGLLPIKFSDATDKNIYNACSITFEPFQETDDVIQLPCNHCYFIEPIMKWLTEDSCECPVCRYKFDSMEKKIVEEKEKEEEKEEEEEEKEEVVENLYQNLD